MGFDEVLRVLQKSWLLIVVCVLVPMIGAWGLSNAATPVYTASATSFVSLSFGNSPGELTQGTVYVRGQLESYAQLAETPTVLDPVIEELGLTMSAAQLAGKISVTIPGDTTLLTVKATDPSPQLAADIANQVAGQLAVTALDLAPKDQNGDPSVVMSTVKAAAPPSTPTSPQTSRNILLGAFTGLLVGIGLSFLRTALDTRVRNGAEVVEAAKVPLLAEIPTNARMGRGQSVLAHTQGDPTLEQYVRLRTNLQFVAIGRKPLVLAVTSAVAGEGKTSTVTNLALTHARSGDRTLVIDTDLRKQQMSSLFGVDQGVGLTAVLTGQVEFADAVQKVRTAGGPLHVLPAGQMPPNPVELLASPQMRAFLEQVSPDFDVIILDTPAVVPVVDAAVVAGMATGALLVARPGVVHRKDLHTAVDAFRQADAQLLGVVVNGVRLSKSSSYYGRDTKQGAGKSNARVVADPNDRMAPRTESLRNGGKQLVAGVKALAGPDRRAGEVPSGD